MKKNNHINNFSIILKKYENLLSKKYFLKKKK